MAGAGLGDLVVFDAAGRRLARMEPGAWFNAPWGIAMAPGEFGEFSHALLVGMFGSGQIAAFNPINVLSEAPGLKAINVPPAFTQVLSIVACAAVTVISPNTTTS